MEQPNNIGNRVKELIFRLNMNQSSFAKSIGVSQNAIFNTINGGSMPRYKLLSSILETYSSVNKDWLLEGKGEMFINEPLSNQSRSGGEYLEQHLRELESEFKKELIEMRKVFQHELEVKNRQIERLMDLLGKGKRVTGTGVFRKLPLIKELQRKVVARGA